MKLNDINKAKIKARDLGRERLESRVRVEEELTQLELIRMHACEVRKALITNDWFDLEVVKKLVGINNE